MTEWITTAEAAELSGYNSEYVRRLVRSNKIKARKFGVVWQIDKISLVQYIRQSRDSSDQRRGPKE